MTTAAPARVYTLADLLAITPEQIDATVARVETRARARTCAEEGEDICALIREAVEIAQAAGLPPEKVEVYSDGGAVPNSYNKGMGGEMTRLIVNASGVHAERCRARQVAGGGRGIRYCRMWGTEAEKAAAQAAGLKRNSQGWIVLEKAE